MDLGGYKWSLSDGDGGYYFQVDKKFGIDGFWPDEEYIIKLNLPETNRRGYIVDIWIFRKNIVGCFSSGLAQVKDLYKKDGKSFAEAYPLC